MIIGPLMIDIEGTCLSPQEVEFLKSPVVGGVILFSRNYKNFHQLLGLVEEIKSIKSPAPIIAVDHEGGRVQRFKDPLTIIPSMTKLGNLYNKDIKKSKIVAYRIGWLLAAEIRSIGIDLAFTPVVDLDLGISSIIGDRSIHSNHIAVSEMALELTTGMRDAGMSSTAKHFPSHSGAKNDSHKEIAIDQRNYLELNKDIYPYSLLIRSELESIMISHVVFPKIHDVPASLSSVWIKDKLRGELNFNGAIITDDLSMSGAALKGEDPTDLVTKSLQSGCDMVILCNSTKKISKIIANLDGYVNYDSQPRLEKLYGKGEYIFSELKDNDLYLEAQQAIANLK